jgi:hypothetical protein
VPHHPPVLRQFRQFIVIEVCRRSLAQLLFDGLAQVLYQVETVGDLPRLSRALLRRRGIKATPVSTDNHDSGLFRQPGCSRPDGTIMQYIDDLPTLEIHHDGAAPGSLQPTPVIDANA